MPQTLRVTHRLSGHRLFLLFARELNVLLNQCEDQNTYLFIFQYTHHSNSCWPNRYSDEILAILLTRLLWASNFLRCGASCAQHFSKGAFSHFRAHAALFKWNTTFIVFQIYQWQQISLKFKILKFIRVLKVHQRSIFVLVCFEMSLNCCTVPSPTSTNEPLHSRSLHQPSITFLWQRTLIARKVQTSRCVRQHRWRTGARNGIWISISIMNSAPTIQFHSVLNLTCEPF